MYSKIYVLSFILFFVACKSDNSGAKSEIETQEISVSETQKVKDENSELSIAVESDNSQVNTDIVVNKKENLEASDPCAKLLAEFSVLVEKYLTYPEDEEVLDKLFEIEVSDQHNICKDKNAKYLKDFDEIMEKIE